MDPYQIEDVPEQFQADHPPKQFPLPKRPEKPKGKPPGPSPSPVRIAQAEALWDKIRHYPSVSLTQAFYRDVKVKFGMSTTQCQAILWRWFAEGKVNVWYDEERRLVLCGVIREAKPAEAPALTVQVMFNKPPECVKPFRVGDTR